MVATYSSSYSVHGIPRKFTAAVIVKSSATDLRSDLGSPVTGSVFGSSSSREGVTPNDVASAIYKWQRRQNSKPEVVGSSSHWCQSSLHGTFSPGERTPRRPDSSKRLDLRSDPPKDSEKRSQSSRKFDAVESFGGTAQGYTTGVGGFDLEIISSYIVGTVL